jgi:hypothetical protein
VRASASPAVRERLQEAGDGVRERCWRRANGVDGVRHPARVVPSAWAIPANSLGGKGSSFHGGSCSWQSESGKSVERLLSLVRRSSAPSSSPAILSTVCSPESVKRVLRREHEP